MSIIVVWAWESMTAVTVKHGATDRKPKFPRADATAAVHRAQWV